MPRIGPNNCQYCNEKSTPENAVFRYVEKLPDDTPEEKVLVTKNGNSYGNSFFLHEKCKRKKPGNFILFRDAYQRSGKIPAH